MAKGLGWEALCCGFQLWRGSQLWQDRAQKEPPQSASWEHEEQNQVPVGPWWQSPKPRGSDGDMIRARLLPQEARAGRPFSWGLEALPSE